MSPRICERSQPQFPQERLRPCLKGVSFFKLFEMQFYPR